MNPIQALKSDVERALPGVDVKVRRPRREDGHWWLDATYKGHDLTIEWSPRRGFGISTDDPAAGYGEGPDEVIRDPEAATRRVIELLAQRSHTIPPHDVVLRDLRAVLGFTQEQLAERLGVQQAAVSRLERRSDMTLSSLRRYVEALGAQLEINVRTSDGEQIRLVSPARSAKARAACAHVATALCAMGQHPIEQPGAEALDDIVRGFEDTVGQLWSDFGTTPRLEVEDTSVELACSFPIQRRIAINRGAACTLSRKLTSVMQTSNSSSSRSESAHLAVFRFLIGHEIGHLLQDQWTHLCAASPRFADPELRADAIAGWLSGRAGDEAASGSIIASLLGCRSFQCTHPSPEERSFAFLMGHAHGTSARRESSGTLTLLVLRVANLDVSRSFYEHLGLRMRPEQHGTGPLHYSCTIQGTTMELYPRANTSDRIEPQRLGFRAGRHSIGRLRSSGLLRRPPHVIRSDEGGVVYLVRDPDDNSIEVEMAA